MDGPARSVQVFVSYSARSKAERELATQLTDLLTTALSLPPEAIFAYTAPGLGATSGGKLLEELKEALTECAVVLAIVTPAAAESEYTRLEMAASYLAGKYCVPLLPDPSFQTHVPVVFKDVTARGLSSLGELCTLLEDIHGRVGQPGLEAPHLWIDEAERVVAASREVAGHVPAEAEIAQLQTRLAAAEGEVPQLQERVAAAQARSSSWFKMAMAAGVVAVAMLLTSFAVWRQQTSELAEANAKLDQATAVSHRQQNEIDRLNQTNDEVNRRHQFLPQTKIEGKVQTVAGAPAGNVVVAACVDLPAIGVTRPANTVCPEEWSLPSLADSGGTFTIDVGSLPLPESFRPSSQSQPQEIWLVARGEHGSDQARVKTVIPKILTLRPTGGPLGGQ